MPAVRVKRLPHHRRHHHHHHAPHRPRSDQALFTLILAVLVVAALSLGVATSLFHP